MPFIISFVALLVIWYVICDRIASTRVDYAFPIGCCCCNSCAGLKHYEVERTWTFDIDVAEEIFPYVARIAHVPICEACLERVEASRKLAHTICLRLAVVLYIIPAAGFLVGLIRLNLRPEWPFLVVFLSEFLIAGFVGLPVALLGYFGIERVLRFLPRFAPPAHFTMFGKLRFRNKVYQRTFSQLNPNPEVRLPQQELPINVIGGIVLLAGLSILSDIIDIVFDTTTANAVSVTLILGKVISVLCIFRRTRLGIILFYILFVANIVINRSLSGDDKSEIIAIGVAFLVVFVYEWWQTRPTGGSPSGKAV